MPRPTGHDYRALAEFRYRLREFLVASENAARSAGIEPEQYQLLLGVRGMPRGREVTIQAVAERLCVRHNTAVERVDRVARMGLLRRVRSHTDARRVLVEVTARGEGMLGNLAAKHLAELRLSGPVLIAALAKVISATRKSPRKPPRSHSRKQHV